MRGQKMIQFDIMLDNFVETLTTGGLVFRVENGSLRTFPGPRTSMEKGFT